MVIAALAELEDADDGDDVQDGAIAAADDKDEAASPGAKAGTAPNGETS